MKNFAITNFWVAQHRRKPILLSVRTCQGVAPTQFREILIFDIRRKISRDFSQIVIFEITVPKTSFWIFSSSARESPWNSTKFMSRKISPKIISSWISSSFKIKKLIFSKKNAWIRGENRIPRSDKVRLRVARFEICGKPGFAWERHKCRPVHKPKTGFCSRTTQVQTTGPDWILLKVDTNKTEVPCWRSTKIEARETQLKMTEARVGTTRIRLLPSPRALQTHPSQRSRRKAFEVGRFGFGLTEFLVFWSQSWLPPPKKFFSFFSFTSHYREVRKVTQLTLAHAALRCAKRTRLFLISKSEDRDSDSGHEDRSRSPVSGWGGWSPRPPSFVIVWIFLEKRWTY